MENNDYIEFENGSTSIYLPVLAEEILYGVSLAKIACRRGEKNAFNYSEEELIEMLTGGDYEEVHEALGAIGKRKLTKALPYLKDMVLYDEDKSTQEESILTIKKIGGSKALDILKFSKTTEHKEFIDDIFMEDSDEL